ncbi:hypothetical protein FS418_12970 [Shewanella sp. YLB-09]|uniref:Uncharacterized protein n=1 Tax=Shewanella eurypsychrophilus TaxID=2593656 RepID=A0A550AJ47_9GAMM|nr:hypothetical protein FS418_12970 [Shewanella sp. YLB-09]
MNIVIFVALFLVYFYTCLFAVKFYKHLIGRLEAVQRKSILNLIINSATHNKWHILMPLTTLYKLTVPPTINGTY